MKDLFNGQPRDVGVGPCYLCGEPTALFSPFAMRLHLETGVPQGFCTDTLFSSWRPLDFGPPELEEDELSYRVADALKQENRGTFESKFQYVARLALKAEVRRGLKNDPLG